MSGPVYAEGRMVLSGGVDDWSDDVAETAALFQVRVAEGYTEWEIREDPFGGQRLCFLRRATAEERAVAEVAKAEREAVAKAERMVRLRARYEQLRALFETEGGE